MQGLFGFLAECTISMSADEEWQRKVTAHNFFKKEKVKLLPTTFGKRRRRPTRSRSIPPPTSFLVKAPPSSRDTVACVDHYLHLCLCMHGHYLWPHLLTLQFVYICVCVCVWRVRVLYFQSLIPHP